MPNTTATMSALEWFFRTPAASNFPQDTSSPELRQLSTAANHLSKALNSLESAADLSQLKEHAISIANWVGKVNSAERIERETLNSLMQELEILSTLVASLDKPKIMPVVESLNATVIALVIFAKSSQDVAFREQIVKLAKKVAAL